MDGTFSAGWWERELVGVEAGGRGSGEVDWKLLLRSSLSLDWTQLTGCEEAAEVREPKRFGSLKGLRSEEVDEV